MDMSIWTLIQNYRDETGATEAAILRRAELNKGTFTAWRQRGVPQLPSRLQLLNLAGALKVDYETVVMAILHDAKYLPEDVARAEQNRIFEESLFNARRYQAELDEHVQGILEDSQGNVDAARTLNHELRVDGSIAPDLADDADVALSKIEQGRPNEEAVAFKGPVEPNDSFD